MTTVTVSSKFQVVIPEDVRSRMKLQPGQKVVVVEKDGVVHLIPLKPSRSCVVWLRVRRLRTFVKRLTAFEVNRLIRVDRVLHRRPISREVCSVCAERTRRIR